MPKPQTLLHSVSRGSVHGAAAEPVLWSRTMKSFGVRWSARSFDPDGGSTPGGTAATYCFFIADDASEEESEHDVLALEAALQSDFRTLEARHGQELDEIMRARKPG